MYCGLFLLAYLVEEIGWDDQPTHNGGCVCDKCDEYWSWLLEGWTTTQRGIM